ncbi:hypothetical protein GCM10010185_45000 [Saccharothrix coeruleofusca]|uniref:Uncharacterized protein n=1 Tax=Saccharothrix coeruleofusca TaxID=33919 RepID=A0A918AP03_9PSEU|nr:hypothetical protein GCM10010185_45000 [Saccharothrix coeruleofusca]
MLADIALQGQDTDDGHDWIFLLRRGTLPTSLRRGPAPLFHQGGAGARDTRPARFHLPAVG